MAVLRFKDEQGNWNRIPERGPKGIDGKSAYQLAVEKGYAGTLEEWLSTLHGSNDNLLVNWDFRNPVNQRGVTTNWTVGKYGLDRWILDSGTCIVSSGGITLNGVLAQRMEAVGTAWPLNGRVLTASIMSGDGTIESGQIVPSGTGTVVAQIGGITVGLYNEAQSWKAFHINTNGAAVNIAAVKLELGMVSTQAQDPPMDYGAEMLKCQRYYQPPRSCMVQAYAAGYAPSIPLMGGMRGNPTITDVVVRSLSNTTMASGYLSGASPYASGIISVTGATAGQWLYVSFAANAEL